MYQIDIPGLEINGNREFRYFSMNENEKIKGRNSMFNKITTLYEEPFPEGGALAENFIIVIPNGEKYYGLSYHGDIDGWRKQIEKNAESQNKKIGRIIDTDTFLLNDNTKCNLKDCEFFVHGCYGKDHKVIKELIHLKKYIENNNIKLVLENDNIL
jgi:hypothetical protein